MTARHNINKDTINNNRIPYDSLLKNQDIIQVFESSVEIIMLHNSVGEMFCYFINKMLVLIIRRCFSRNIVLIDFVSLAYVLNSFECADVTNTDDITTKSDRL